MRRSPQSDDDLPKGPVVHVESPRPRDGPRIDVQGVVVIHGRVQCRRQEVVRRGHSVEVAREVEVDLLHGKDLGVPPAGPSSLGSEHRTDRGLAHAEHGPGPRAGQALRQPDGGGGLALASAGRRDRGDHDELAVGPVTEPAEHRQAHLGLIPAVRLDLVLQQPGASGDVRDGQQSGRLCDLQAGPHRFAHRRPPSPSSTRSDTYRLMSRLASSIGA